MRVRDFEAAIWELDTVRVVIRAPGDAKVHDFDYQKAAPYNQSIAQFRTARVDRYVGDANLEYAIIDGRGIQPNGNSNVGTVRDSYGE